MAQNKLQTATQPIQNEDALVHSLEQANSSESTWDLHEPFDAEALSVRWDEIAADWGR